MKCLQNIEFFLCMHIFKAISYESFLFLLQKHRFKFELYVEIKFNIDLKKITSQIIDLIGLNQFEYKTKYLNHPEITRKAEDFICNAVFQNFQM